MRRSRVTSSDEAASTDYVIVVETVATADGGGYLATVPDLGGCMAKGSTYSIVIKNVRAAIAEWITESRRLGYDVPLPPSALPNPFDRQT
jgi:antitoxin HicB